jgi:hypothetical protein
MSYNILGYPLFYKSLNITKSLKSSHMPSSHKFSIFPAYIFHRLFYRLNGLRAINTSTIFLVMFSLLSFNQKAENRVM